MTVKELHAALGRLVDDGKGDLPAVVWDRQLDHYAEVDYADEMRCRRTAGDDGYTLHGVHRDSTVVHIS